MALLLLLLLVLLLVSSDVVDIVMAQLLEIQGLRIRCCRLDAAAGPVVLEMIVLGAQPSVNGKLHA